MTAEVLSKAWYLESYERMLKNETGRKEMYEKWIEHDKSKLIQINAEIGRINSEIEKLKATK